MGARSPRGSRRPDPGGCRRAVERWPVHGLEGVGVKVDIVAWAPKIKEGGFLSGHDYNNVNDKKGVYGVKRAIDEYAEKNNKKVGAMSGHIWYFE